MFQRCSAPQSEADAQPIQPQEAQSSMSGSPRGSQWATPNSRDHKGIQSKDGSHLARGYGHQLPDHVALAWATPTTRDYKGFYPQWSQESPTMRTRNLLPDQAHTGSYTGKLNPRWVETLMGLPVGWTMPSCADPWMIEQMNCDYSEMGLFPPQQSEPSESCGENWSTPPASQRGETLEVYFRRTIDRMKQGGVRFAPTLQVAVEAEERCIDIAKSLSLITPHLDQDTEDLVQMAMQGES